ncbi:MAG: hypothetical protein HY805_00135 [Nitrospirae bacterium]|nr:hypothetical protein [Nitrospirota bacterium]
MIKRIVVVAILLLALFQGKAFSADTSGEVVFRDAIYGAGIGAILGGAIYLADDDHFGSKIGIGIAVGTIGGLIYGVSETRGVVEIRKEKGSIKLNPPIISVQKKDGDLFYSTNILKISF